MRLPRGFRKVIRKRKNLTARTLIEARVYKYDRGRKRKRISLYGRTVDEVKAKLKKLTERNVASFEAEKETLAKFLELWLAELKLTRQPRTYELYEGIIRNHVVPYIGTLRLTQVGRADIRHLVSNTLRDIGSRARQLTYRVLHYALGQAVEDELIAFNPCLRKDKPRHVIAEYKSLTHEQARRLLEAASRGNYYVLFYLALSTGMRQGEIFALQWSAIDFDNNSLYVTATLTRDEEGNPVLSPPKASRKRRIELGPKLMTMLREHKRRQYPLAPWVFAGQKGEPLQKDKFVRSVFHPLLKEAGIERIRFHDLRHTSATLGIAAGENVKVIAERLGHSSAKLTLDVYTKSLPTLQREAAVRMDAILSSDGGMKGGTPKTEEA